MRLFFSFPSCTWERKYLPSLAWRVNALPGPAWRREKSQSYFLFWDFLLVYINRREDVAKAPSFSKKQRRRYFCSATATVLQRNFLEIKGLAGQTPPAPCGAKAAQIPHFSEAGKHAGLPIVSYLPK